MKRIILFLLLLLIMPVATAQNVIIDGIEYYDVRVLDFKGIKAPSVSLTNRARMYMDSTSGTIKCSEDGDAYTDCLGFSLDDEVYGEGWNGSVEAPTKNAVYDKVQTLGASGGGTTDAGTVVHVTTATDDFAVGGATSAAPIFIDESAETIKAENGFRLGDNTDNDFTVIIVDLLSGDQSMVWDDTNQEWDFSAPINASGTGQSALNQGLTVNDGGGNTGDDDFIVESANETHFIHLDASADILYLGDGNATNRIALSSSGAVTFGGTASIALPAGTIDSAAEIAADLITHTQILDSDQTDTKCIWFEDPVAADDFKSIWANKTANDFQVTEIWGESDQTVTFMLQLDDGSPADCDTVDLAPAAGEAEDTSLDGDCLISAGEELDLDIASVASTPTWVSICWTGNWVD